jgi:stearoyl-CoA 9-desaturase NADPH oxidoreductase
MSRSTAARKPRTRPLDSLLRSKFVSALTAPHGVDRYLEVMNPTWTVHEVRARVVAVEKETEDATTLVLRPNGVWAGHVAGQFVNVGREIAGVRHTRCYSISSSESRDDGRFTLTVKAKDGGYVSGDIVRNAQVGQVLVLSQAQGEFLLPAERPARILFVSGGSGITPVMGMLRTLLDEGYGGDIVFLHYARSRADLIYGRELEALAASKRANVRVVLAYTREQSGELTGHFGTEHLVAAVPDYASRETFSCGPAALMQAVRSAWEAEGLLGRLHEERFTLPAFEAIVEEGAEPGRVHFAKSQVDIDGDGRALLVQAEEAGLQPEFGCRMGICMTCLCTKKSGTVRDLRNGALSSDPDVEIQICVSAPVGDVILDL